MKKLVLIDSHALIHRAFHALPMLTAPDGRPTNAVYGFVSVLLKMLADLKPEYVVATFDLAGPTFRHKEYEQYKAHRQRAPDELYAQIPAVKSVLEAFGIPVLECEGFEADDIIGTLSEQMRDEPDVQTVIMTGDLDTLQLVQGKKTVVFTLRKGVTDTITYDEDAVRDRYGISPAQVPDLKGLKGDPSDNIPGVAGVGEKTAVALVQAFGSLEGALDAATAEKPKKPLTPRLAQKLQEQRDIALSSKQLATIRRNVPITFALENADWNNHADPTAVERLFRDLGFYSLAKRVPGILGAVAKASAVQTLDLNGSEKQIKTIHVPGLDQLPDGKRAAMHAVFTNGTVTALLVTTDGKKVFSLNEPSPEIVAAALGRYPTIVGHDLKPLLRFTPDPLSLKSTLVDTMIAAWLVNPDRREYPLDRVLHEANEQLLPADPAAQAVTLFPLENTLRERLKSMDLERLANDVEMPLIPILAAMEKIGIRVDSYNIADLLEIAAKEVGELERKIWKMAEGEFNINSPSQLSDVLFTKLAIKGKVRRTGGGAPSTAAAELEKLRDEHPIIDLVLQYREMNKLKTTYIEPFPSLVGADGRIHTTYNQTGTSTGRLSSSDPNLQNIPTRTELGQRFRASFIAPPAYRLLSLDYSQLELRLVAHIAKDETMIQAFRDGEDIHTRTACEVFGVAPAQVTKDMRRQAKVLNFGIIYGMGTLGFARAAGVSRDAARKFIDEYFTRFSGVARYLEATKAEALEKGYVQTLLGRRRPLPDITSGIPQLAAAAERMAINHPIQGTGADLVKVAMLAVARHIRAAGWSDEVRLLLQVHDELVLEVPSTRAEEFAQVIRNIMEQVYPLDVPVIVDVKVGDNWAVMENIPRNDA